MHRPWDFEAYRVELSFSGSLCLAGRLNLPRHRLGMTGWSSLNNLELSSALETRVSDKT